MARTRLILDFLARGQAHRYGPHASQRADLYLPIGPGPHPVMILIHGGSWQKRYASLHARAGRRSAQARLGRMEHRVPPGRRRRGLAEHVRGRGRGDRPSRRTRRGAPGPRPRDPPRPLRRRAPRAVGGRPAQPARRGAGRHRGATARAAAARDLNGRRGGSRLRLPSLAWRCARLDGRLSRGGPRATPAIRFASSPSPFPS